MVLLDLRNAFDLVNHTVLLEKMAIYGCSQQSMQWFTSYLSERQQFVQFKGKLSHQGEIQTEEEEEEEYFYLTLNKHYTNTGHHGNP